MDTGSERFRTSSPDETRELGRALGVLLEPGDLVALTGELGSGKTVMIQGIARGLGFDGYVSSPSFVIVNEYGGRAPIYHVDLYRIEGAESLHDIGYRELFFGDGVVLVEWADRAPELLPAERLEVRIEMTGRDGRVLAIEARGVRSAALLRRLAAAS